MKELELGFHNGFIIFLRISSKGGRVVHRKVYDRITGVKYTGSKVYVIKADLTGLNIL